nr:metal-dependent hydrolase [uncultured Carboxylicivirga sp.]
MDILTHGLTGMALSTAVAAQTSSSWKGKLWIGIAGGFGGILPDVDVISKWGGFDTTFGKWFNLQQSGHEIFWDTHWYSHHVFTHSVVGSLFFILIGSLIYMAYAKAFGITSLNRLVWYSIAFFMGYMGHLTEDMITPGGSWDGIAFFWPSAHFTGGWGKVWWWNNYDLFLIVVAALTINTGLIITRYKTALLTKITILAAILLFTIQIERRNHNFNLSENKEELSKELQKQYLGETIFKIMQKADDIIPVAF